MNLYKIVLSLVLVVSSSSVVAMKSGDKYPRYFETHEGRIIRDRRQYNGFGVPCDTPPVECYVSTSATKKNIKPENYKNPLNQQNAIECFFGFIYDEFQALGAEKLTVDVNNHLSIKVGQDIENSPTSTVVQFSPDNKIKCKTIIPFSVAKGILKNSN